MRAKKRRKKLKIIINLDPSKKELKNISKKVKLLKKKMNYNKTNWIKIKFSKKRVKK